MRTTHQNPVKPLLKKADFWEHRELMGRDVHRLTDRIDETIGQVPAHLAELANASDAVPSFGL